MQIGQPWKDDPRELSLRPYSGTPDDLAALTRVRNETMEAITLPEDYSHFSPEEMDRFYSRPDFSLVDNAWLIFHRDEPVAAAIVYPPAIFQDRPPGNFDMYVVPQMSRHGLGSRLLAHLEVAAAERGYPVLETTVAREDELSTRFLTTRGFGVVGHSLHLARNNMENLPKADIPDGYAIRSLQALRETPELYRDTANRLGAYDPNYSLITPEALEQLLGGTTWEPEGVLFLLDSVGRIVGIIRASGAKSGKSYLHEIRLEPSLRGQGLGMVMLASALRYLADAGVERAELDTPGESTPAHTLALKAGFEVVRHWLHFLKRLSTKR